MGNKQFMEIIEKYIDLKWNGIKFVWNFVSNGYCRTKK